MQRLRKLRRSPDAERGAVSVVVALLSIVLIGFAAVTVDLAAVWADKQQLQTGADAAALAIAQDCADGVCGTPSATAQSLAKANKNDGNVTTTLTGPSGGQVTVAASTVRQHWFAPVFGPGFESSPVLAKATARWGNPTGGTARLPLAFSWCEFLAQTGGGTPSGFTEHTINLTKTSGTTCTGPSNNIVPGGFGWLKPSDSTCTASTSWDQVVFSDTGESPPNQCTPADFSAAQNQVVLLPIFKEYSEDASGANAWYRVHGYAAFKLTGYRFTGTYSWNAPCSGNNRCVRGYFVEWVDLGSAFTYGGSAPDLGASVVSLTN